MRVRIIVFLVMVVVGWSPAKAQQAEAGTAQRPAFKFAKGQGVYVLTLEAIQGPPNKLQTRLDGVTYSEAKDAFLKKSPFLPVASLAMANFVFICVRQHEKHGAKAIGLAIRPEDLTRYVITINEMRQETDLTGLFSVSLWTSQAGLDTSLHSKFDYATGNHYFYQGNYEGVGRLVSQFSKDAL